MLIVDDLGTELNNALVSSELFFCLNERAIRPKSTLISTNFSMNQIRAGYSERAVVTAHGELPAGPAVQLGHPPEKAGGAPGTGTHDEKKQRR